MCVSSLDNGALHGAAGPQGSLASSAASITEIDTQVLLESGEASD